MINTANNDKRSGTQNAAQATTTTKRSLSASVQDLMRERDGMLPVWVRSPKAGPEHYTGFTRAKLYELAGRGEIRSVSIREPGQMKGTRLFHLASILHFVERCETAAAKETHHQETAAA